MTSKAARRRYAQRKIRVVDAFESGYRAGLVVLRLGKVYAGSRPVNVVCPPSVATSWFTGLHTAAREAEEDYWNLIVPLTAEAGPDATNDMIGAHVERWLLGLDWAGLMMRTPDPEPPYLLTHAGHVALALDPPATVEPVLLIFDPQQLQRVYTEMKASIAGAGDTPLVAPKSVMQSVAEAHRFLEGQPWPDPNAMTPVTEQDATQSVLEAWGRFLARSPVESTGKLLLPPDSSDAG